MKNFLGFDPYKGQKSHAELVSKIQQKVPLQTHHWATSLTNGVHLDLVALVLKGMLTRTESATLQAQRFLV